MSVCTGVTKRKDGVAWRGDSPGEERRRHRASANAERGAARCGCRFLTGEIDACWVRTKTRKTASFLV